MGGNCWASAADPIASHAAQQFAAIPENPNRIRDTTPATVLSRLLCGRSDNGFSIADQCRLRASWSSRSVQARKLNSSQREAHTKLITLLAVRVSARWPEYVSTRQRRYALRQGANRWPRVAFQMNRRGASKPFSFSIEYRRKGRLPEHCACKVKSREPVGCYHGARSCGGEAVGIAAIAAC